MKKRLLMTFDGRRYGETFRGVLLSLKDHFDIWILGYDISTPAYVKDELNGLIKQGVIKGYSLCPYPPFTKIGLWQKHWFINQQVLLLKDIRFDVWLTIGESQVLERYINDCLLIYPCKKIVLWTGLTYLFEQESLVRQLLQTTTRGQEVVPLLSKGNINQRESVALIKHLRKFLGWIKRLPIRSKKLIDAWQDRYIFPFILQGKVFHPRAFDALTQIGSGNSDAYVFCDEAEALAHQALFKKGKFFVGVLPTVNKTDTVLTRKALLSPSSIFIGQTTIASSYMALMLRDYKLALAKTGANEIDFRMHPDELSTWYVVLIDYLRANGLVINVVGCDKPIREVINNYVGMAGLSSCALRDAHMAAPHLPVIGFEGGSKFRFKNPMFVYGLSDGIDWILEDGTWQHQHSQQRMPAMMINDIIYEVMSERIAYV